MHKDMRKMTPEPSDHIVYFLRAGMLYLNSQPESQKNWGQVDVHPNDDYSDPMHMSSEFWKLYIIEWWCQQEDIYLKACESL